MGQGNITPNFNQSIFRTDHPIILACQAHLARLVPIWIDFVSGGILAGTVMGQNSDDNNYGVYNHSASSGLNTAVGILLDNADWEGATGGAILGTLIIGGEVYDSKLTGLDSYAITALGGRVVTDARNQAIFTF